MASAQFLEAIRRFDLFTYLDDLGVDLKVVSDGEYYYIACWDCGKHKMYIHNHEDFKGFFKCWVCGTKGDLFDLISHYEHISRAAAIHMVLGYTVNLAEVDEMSLFNFEILKKEAKVDKNAEICLPFNLKKLTSIKHSKCYTYARTRGLTDEMLNKFGVLGSDMMKRVVFPVFEKGKTVGWQGRTILKNIEPKLLTSKGFKRSINLYNYDQVKDKTSIVIVEGPIDALKAYKHNSVALLGKSLSKEHLVLLHAMPHLKKIYVALDPDAALEAQTMAKMLSSYWDIHVVRLPQNTDIGQCDEDEIDYYITTSQPYGQALSFGRMLDEAT